MASPRADTVLRAYVSRLLGGWPAAAKGWRAVDGTLAFADVSGFTNLTERLARRGKVGAEEMSDILSACFSELLGVADGYGADLVKWGGDAVLLLFDGPQHATRAALASLAMQETMDRVGRIRSTGGSTSLRMSIGIQSGRFHFFVAGIRPVDLIPAGAGVTRTVLVEALAEPGEVAVSESTAAALPPELLGERREDTVILRTALVERPPVPARGPDPEVDLRRFLAQPIAEHLLWDHREAEHRRAAVAFLELGETDTLLEQHGPDRLHEALEGSLEAVQEACLLHRVTYLESDISKGAVKVLLVAGAPVGAGHEEERMLRAAGAIVTAGLPLPVRAAITTGRVFTGDFGPDWRRTYSIKGDVVNLAARILGRAEYGQVLAEEEVLVRSRQGFQAEALQPFMVKGKELPIRASVVGAPSDLPAAEPDRTALVGRERELGILRAALERAAGGQGAMYTLLGEPGLGKTRLVDEIADHPGSARVVRTAALEYEMAVPYRPFRTLLRSLLEISEHETDESAGAILAQRVADLAPDLVPWLPLLAIPVDARVDPTNETESLDDRFRAERMIEVAGLLLAALLPGPTLLVFEDAHWMDAASRGLLAELGRVVAALPWLLLVTQRGEQGVAGDSSSWLRLQPLDATEALFLAESSGLTLGAHELKTLADRAGGNPLFLKKLVAAAAAPGGIPDLPDSVESLLTAQIDGLPPADRRVLRYAAVLGTSFERRLLMAALDERLEVGPETWRRLAEFLHLEGQEIRFRHALVRDAAYEGLPYRRRRELHAAVGETIERSSPGGPEAAAGVLSLHFLHAERFDAAWRYAGLAARQAAAAYAHVEARTLYLRALEAGRRLRRLPPDEVVGAWRGLGAAQVRLGEFAEARAAFQAARRRAAYDPLLTAELMLSEAQAWHWVGNQRQTMRVLTRALHVIAGLAGEDAAGVRARLLVLQAVARLQLGRAAEAIGWLRRAVQEAEAGGDRATLGYAYDILDWALVSLRRFDEAVHAQRALAIFEELGDLDQLGRVLNNLGVAAHIQGLWLEALGYYARAEEAWKRAGNHFLASFPADNTGLILLSQGRLAEAEPLFRDALRVARASRSPLREGPILLNLGMLATRTGRLAEGEDLLQAARRSFAAESRTPWVHMTDARLAELWLARGEVEAALRLATSALERAQAGEEVFALRAILHRLRATALQRLGRAGDADAEIEASLEQARLVRDSYEEALALAWRGSSADAGRLAELAQRLGLVSLPEPEAAAPASGREPQPSRAGAPRSGGQF